MLPLFQMAERFWPFHARSCVKPWPLGSASRSHCVWVRGFRRGSNCVINSQHYEKTKLNLHLLGLYHWKFCVITYEERQAPRVWISRKMNQHSPTTPTKKSVNVYSGLLSHLFFPLSNFFFPSPVSGWNLGKKKEGEWWDISASLWRVKVSLLAWWLVHSADVTWSLSWARKPSAWLLLQRTCFSSVFWVLCDWQEPRCVLFHPDLLLHLPPVSRGPVWLEPEGRRRMLTENRCKGKIWSLWNNENW